ncbi:MAG: peptidoglycan D,D-transpeptidase FtsI family protein, partial [Acidimicrobiia bacterium]
LRRSRGAGDPAGKNTAGMGQGPHLRRSRGAGDPAGKNTGKNIAASRLTGKRAVTFLAVVFVGMVVVLGRLTQVQAVSASTYAAKGSSQRVRHITLAAERGSIFDRNGVDLALSVATQTVWANPRVVDDPVRYAAKLAPVLGVDQKFLEGRLAKDSQAFVYLARKVDDATAAAVEALDLPGVDFVPESKRFYPAGTLAAPVLGNVGVDNQGLAGIEVSWEEALAGEPGEIVVEQDPGGRRIPAGRSSFRPAERGADLILTIDQALQYEVEQALVEAVAGARARGGTAVISDVRTGKILAMANVTGDEGGNARPSHAGEKNRPVTDVYEPGSTNKVVTLSGAIEDKIVTPESTMTVPDKLAVGNHVFSDHDPHPPMSMSVTDILAQSSNIGTIMVGQKLGKERLDHYMRAFGYGQKSGIGFPGEATGLLIDPEDYWITTMGSVPIGNSVAVTALQMLGVYATVANGGVWRAPRLVDATVDADGVRHPTGAGGTRRVISPQTAGQIKQMLRKVVTDGTGGNAAIDGYTVAGKTGTARKPRVGARGYEGYVASFAGFVPAEEPRLAAVVVVDEPKGLMIYGAQVAAPVFSRVVQYALRLERIPPPPPPGPPPAPAAAPVPAPASAPPASTLRPDPPSR